MLPEYKQGLLQVSASIRHWAGLSSEYQDHAELSAWLKAGHFRCVIALLIDGMGSEILAAGLPADSFFRRHLLVNTETVYPPTTAAATTAFLSGRSPKETGWLGWNQYFQEKDDQIILFRNIGQYSGRPYPGYSYQALPVQMLYDELNEKGIKADSVWPAFAAHNGCLDFSHLLARTSQLAEDPAMRFVYAYWDGFDSLMHQEGPSALPVQKNLQQLNAETEQFAAALPADVGLLVLADHGQIDVKHYDLYHDRQLCSCLRLAPALEGRTCAFYVKPERMAEFPGLFRRRLGPSFELWSHQEVIDRSLFGPGKANPRFEEFIGDYLALAVSDLQLDYLKGGSLNGNHAGTLAAEIMIPLIVSPAADRQVG